MREKLCIIMERIPLSVFEKFNNQELLLDVPEDRFISKSLQSPEIFSTPCEECTYFTKSNNNNILKFDDTTGLNTVLVSYTQQSKKRKQKKTNASSKGRPKIIGSDLTQGFSDFKPGSLKDIYLLNNIFKSIQYLIQNKNFTPQDFKIVTARRHLQKLMTIPIHKQEVQFNVIYWKGMIFFAYDWKSESTTKVEDPYNKLIQYTGFKFEEVVSEGTRDLNFYTVVQHCVDNIPVIYTAEVDCSIDKETGLENYIELKTHTKLADDKISTINKLNKKLLSTFIQTKFIDCQHSIIGFRSTNLKIASIKKYTQRELAGEINSFPVILSDKCSINTKLIFQWYKLIMNWIILKEITDHNTPQIFRLSFKRDQELMNSYLKLEKILQEDDNDTIFNDLVPEWFQSFIMNLF